MNKELQPDDLFWMNLALSLARAAAVIGEVPVGAVIVQNQKLISSGVNLRERTKRPSSHAEVLAIDQAAQNLGTWRLNDCTLYVTLEPCIMCAGAIYLSRMRNVVFGSFDPKGGALGSLYNIHCDERLNHRYPVLSGVQNSESTHLIKKFFAERRRGKKDSEP